MKFSEFLKRIRNTAGYTQQNVADLLGVDRSTYSYYETGKTEPNIRQLQKLSAMYNLRMDDLVNCRYSPLPEADMLSTDLPEEQLVNANRFRMLNRDEQHLLLMFRTARDKKTFIEFAEHFVEGEKK